MAASCLPWLKSPLTRRKQSTDASNPEVGPDGFPMSLALSEIPKFEPAWDKTRASPPPGVQPYKVPASPSTPSHGAGPVPLLFESIGVAVQAPDAAAPAPGLRTKLGLTSPLARGARKPLKASASPPSPPAASDAATAPTAAPADAVATSTVPPVNMAQELGVVALGVLSLFPMPLDTNAVLAVVSAVVPDVHAETLFKALEDLASAASLTKLERSPGSDLWQLAPSLEDKPPVAVGPDFTAKAIAAAVLHFGRLLIEAAQMHVSGLSAGAALMYEAQFGGMQWLLSGNSRPADYARAVKDAWILVLQDVEHVSVFLQSLVPAKEVVAFWTGVCSFLRADDQSRCMDAVMVVLSGMLMQQDTDVDVGVTLPEALESLTRSLAITHRYLLAVTSNAVVRPLLLLHAGKLADIRFLCCGPCAGGLRGAGQA